MMKEGGRGRREFAGDNLNYEHRFIAVALGEGLSYWGCGGFRLSLNVKLAQSVCFLVGFFVEIFSKRNKNIDIQA